MAKKRAAKLVAVPPPERVAIRVLLEPPDEASAIYANYAEATAGTHEILLSFATVPTKLNTRKTEEAKSGTLRVEPLVQVVIPPSLLPGLIRALTITKDGFEKLNGPIKDPEAIDATTL